MRTGVGEDNLACAVLCDLGPNLDDPQELHVCPRPLHVHQEVQEGKHEANAGQGLIGDRNTTHCGAESERGVVVKWKRMAHEQVGSCGKVARVSETESELNHSGLLQVAGGPADAIGDLNAGPTTHAKKVLEQNCTALIVHDPEVVYPLPWEPKWASSCDDYHRGLQEEAGHL